MKGAGDLQGEHKCSSSEKPSLCNNIGPMQSAEIVNGETASGSPRTVPDCESPSSDKKCRTEIESEYFDGMRTQCTKAIHMSVDYLQDVAKHRVFPQVEPGYLRPLLPEEAPEKPEPWEQIFGDVDRLLMPGVRPNI
ncbi:unnamed protein product [Dibothriocephalus latus]|uniref:Uncharacterized protein n=1 Tax=Dibothriocephalus latus TaxID=60516 RepID=A0A3P7MPK9_DIBLA|nr:unnamed protein product [Dibothriocephalus latus]